MNAVAAVLFIEMNNCFGIAIGAVTVAERLELRPQLGMVVNFAVEYNPDCPGFIADGLVTAGFIDDTEAAHSDSGLSIDVNTLIVGAAMRHHVAHRAHGGGIHSRV